jgi:radical SAM protein with 4Fe4S-binding SPASM domain
MINRSITPPYVIAWESTKACHLACVHCRAEAQIYPAEDELTTEEAKQLISQVSGEQRLFIITGGDPLLRSDIFTLAQYAAERNLKVALALSGTDLSEDKLYKIQDAGVKYVSLSLDGSKASIHDSFRGIKGTFDKTISNLSRIKRLKIPFTIQTTITKHNYLDVKTIHSLVENLGAIMWDLFMLVPTGRATIKMEISPLEYEQLMEQLSVLSQESRIPIKMSCTPQYKRIIRKNDQKEERLQNTLQHGCMAGNGYCFISYNGEVYGCGFLPISAGNVKHKSFTDLYERSKLFNDLRKKTLLKGKCGVCEYKNDCGGCRARAYAFDGDYLGEEPYCIYNPHSSTIQLHENQTKLM